MKLFIIINTCKWVDFNYASNGAEESAAES